MNPARHPARIAIGSPIYGELLIGVLPIDLRRAQWTAAILPQLESASLDVLMSGCHGE
jgi:hypothetical protein